MIFFHKEIEADKRQAEKMIKPSSPKKDIKVRNLCMIFFSCVLILCCHRGM